MAAELDVDQPLELPDLTATVQEADLTKMLDVVSAAVKYHQAKDRMNAATHMTPVRFSPLTTNLDLVSSRLKALIAGLHDGEPEEDEQDGLA